MILNEHLTYNFFDVLIDNQIRFALYRLPGEQQIRLVLQTSDEEQTFANWSDLDNKTGFVIAPFKLSKSTPIIVIRPDVVLDNEERIFEYLLRLSSQYRANSQLAAFFETSQAATFDRYQDRYNRFRDALSDDKLQKLVLSRTYEKERGEGFSAGLTFKKGCDTYPDNFIFLCHTPTSGTWLGCSPEILVSGRNGQWESDALAGTQRVTDTANGVTWDDKNRLEQQIVVDYMQEQLSNAGIKSTFGEPQTVWSGNLAHLKTKFEFQIDDPSQIGNLLSLLHPSPAVCGFPKKEALDFIIDNEGYNRTYYSGFLGYLDTHNQTDLFVNLRCMQILPMNLCLFAGGGILPSSELFSEWKETEYKFQTLLSIITNNSQS